MSLVDTPLYVSCNYLVHNIIINCTHWNVIPINSFSKKRKTTVDLIETQNS